MVATLMQIVGAVAAVVGAGVAAGLAGWLIGGGVACVYVGLAAESRG